MVHLPLHLPMSLSLVLSLVLTLSVVLGKEAFHSTKQRSHSFRHSVTESTPSTLLLWLRIRLVAHRVGVAGRRWGSKGVHGRPLLSWWPHRRWWSLPILPSLTLLRC